VDIVAALPRRKIAPDWGPKFGFRAIVDFLARENRRSTKCLLASFGQTLAVICR
jgi:hypothetical protein